MISNQLVLKKWVSTIRPRYGMVSELSRNGEGINWVRCSVREEGSGMIDLFVQRASWVGNKGSCSCNSDEGRTVLRQGQGLWIWVSRCTVLWLWVKVKFSPIRCKSWNFSGRDRLDESIIPGLKQHFSSFQSREWRKSNDEWTFQLQLELFGVALDPPAGISEQTVTNSSTLLFQVLSRSRNVHFHQESPPSSHSKISWALLILPISPLAPNYFPNFIPTSFSRHGFTISLTLSTPHQLKQFDVTHQEWKMGGGVTGWAHCLPLLGVLY